MSLKSFQELDRTILKARGESLRGGSRRLVVENASNCGPLVGPPGEIAAQRVTSSR